MKTDSELTEQLRRGMPDYRKALRKNGWVLLKNVFTKNEIEDFRRRTYLTVGENYSSTDLLSNPHFREVLFGERWLIAARGLLDDKPVYFGESKVLIDGYNGREAGSIHKDNPDRLNAQGPDWSSEYTIIRFALFCQDHAKHSEGLTVRNGSHKTARLNKGKLVYIPSEPGDLVAFYFTTTHSGVSRRVRYLPSIRYVYDKTNRPLLTYFLSRLPRRFHIKKDKERVVMFATFAARSKHLERYLEYCKRRDFAIRTWKNIQYDDETFQFIADKDVDLLDMSNVPSKVDQALVGGHFELPY